MTDAEATIKSALYIAMADTATETRLTIDCCDGLVRAIINELFKHSTRWAIREYLQETEETA